jgi:signal peptidase II
MPTAARASRGAAAVSVLVVIVDQLSKELVRSSIGLGRSRHVIPGLTLVRAENSGIAFSLFTGSEAVVIVVSVVVLAVVIGYFARHRDRRWMWLACGLVAGGAVGNLLDRVRVGVVTDFIKLPDWPAFNIADASITVGVLTLVWIASRGGAAARPA